jgi:phage shock protein E
MMKKIIFILILIISVCVSKAQTANTKVVTNLSAERFKAASSSDRNGVIIDLRTIDEITSKGFIRGAMQIDFLAKDAEQKIDKLDKTKTYYIYCAGGGRSGECAEYMEKQGFMHVYNLEKGFSEWILKGFPVER